ncbi:ribosome 60S biogenesis N-terminal-domain-containing protein [Lasiosphaeria hispida]|uniref:Ribosome 60S biogenesis N-terminal-domain-containing protein n=1 Tax=Lasiosphaeria hispida TaxID=260671 RepID=A0AAJ0HI20_9PEZI|nr:ribosome 60S biogenesis N-terminal-domain-containing protein [Lasiosphaeria hispida]
MGKRVPLGQEADGPSRKRQKIIHEAPTHEEIHTSRQLMQLLSFDLHQDAVRARHGLQSLKVFLDALLRPDRDQADRLAILKEYLQSAGPEGRFQTESDEGQVYLPDIMQMWSHASTNGTENVMSAVPVVLALLLRLLSQSLDLVPFGLGICRTLLQKRQLELISRNLSGEKSKTFIISPTLRMLTEVISFDGGAIAKPLFRARASTFKSLSRNMLIVHIGDEAEDEKRPSARTTAVLFFLSTLKFLHPEAKKELLSQRDVVAALTREIKNDPTHLTSAILNGLRDNVMLDDKVPREAKANMLNVSTLVRISSLYQARQGASDDSTAASIPDVAHNFLTMACTNPSCGVLRQDSGLYPRDVDPNAAIPGAELDELGLEAIVWMNKFKTEVPVRNSVLSNLLQNLRPWASIKQNELATSIFRVAPELVANYFITTKSFTFEPKLSATWMGYAAFLFNTVSLPIPDYFCRGPSFPQLPPPTSLVIDNILPLPMNQKVMVRCLTNKSNLISFFATRILVVAIEKLDTAVRMHQDPSHANRALWGEAARRLVDEFCQRSPGIKDIINAYRSVPEQDILHREAASRLLRLCYEVIPQVALIAKFDVSPLLEIALGRLAKQELEDPRDFALSLKELENLLAIAGYSPGMRWFSASEGLTLSPFTLLLKVCVDAPRGVSLDEIRQVLNFVAVEQQLVPAPTGHPGLLPLLETLQGLDQKKTGSVAHIWSFLDNCLTRCATTPIKYIELMKDLIQDVTEGSDKDVVGAVISPVTVAILEQMPFVVNAADPDVLGVLGRFLPKFLGFSVTVGECKPLLDVIYSKISELYKDAPAKLSHRRISDRLAFQYSPWPPAGDTTAQPANDPVTGRESKTSETDINEEGLRRILEVPDGLTTDNSALVKWTNKTVDELIDEGYAISLVTLLASGHTSIRKEALVNILKMAAKIRQSEYEEKEQVWLLLSEIAETARGHIETDPLPSPAVAFACHALSVVRDPLSTLYPKVNQFLARGPVWNLDRLPLVDEVLLEDPEVGDSFYAQLNWFLQYLVDGLRTPRDLELFHKRRARGPVLERLLSLVSNPYMRLPLRTQVLRILYRATVIEGGSTTLTTRFGVVSWLEAQGKACAGGAKGSDEERLGMIYKALRARVWRTCDRERVGVWSKGGIEELCGEVGTKSGGVEPKLDGADVVMG